MTRASPSFTTLIGALRYQATHRGEQPAIVVDGSAYSYSVIWDRVRHYAAQLKLEGIKPGDTVVITIPNSIEFIISFFAVLQASAVPVPITPQAGMERCLQIMDLCDSRHLIRLEDSPLINHEKLNEFPSGKDRTIHGFQRHDLSTPVTGFRRNHGNEIALIQYTSGSSSFPKGVPLTHRNLLTNIRQMISAMKITDKDVFVSWLPVHHDMGLILGMMVPLFTGAKLVLLTRGLRNIRAWLEAIEAHKASFTAGPDLAYRLCIRGISRYAAYDLSTLRIALNASETPRAQTIRLFEKSFRLENVMITGYGLAEATVAVTIHPLEIPVKTDETGHVSSGRPLKGISVKIKSRGIELAPGKVGEIMVKSPACMRGYHNKSRKRVFDQKGYLHTGDTGYLDKEGFLYVLSRTKDIIKLGGRTIYPDDVEEVAGGTDGTRRIAALGISDKSEDGEQLFIFAESRRNKLSAKEGRELVVRIVDRIYSHFGLRPARVYILRSKALPLTANGKLRRAYLKSVFLENRQSLDKLILYN